MVATPGQAAEGLPHMQEPVLEPGPRSPLRGVRSGQAKGRAVRSDEELREDWDDALAERVMAFDRAIREQKAEHQEAMRDAAHPLRRLQAEQAEQARAEMVERDVVEGDEETRWRHAFAEGAKREPVRYPGRPGVDGRSFDVSGQRGMR